MYNETITFYSKTPPNLVVIIGIFIAIACKTGREKPSPKEQLI